jgi:hypothetical protein
MLAGVTAATGIGCGGSTNTSDAGDPDAGPPPILLRDENNYTSTGSLAIPTVETAPATDLDICWTDVTDDIQCHPVAPAADLNTVSMLRILHLSEEQVENRLSSGELAQSEVDGYLEYATNTTSTCMKLSQLSFFGTVIDVQAEYIETTDQTYLLLFAHGTRPGVGARTMTFVKPTASSTNTRVDAPKGCGMLTFSADLSSLAKVAMPAEAPWVVDWRNVTRDGLGNRIVASAIDGLMLAFYEGMSVAEIQADIFDLELNATAIWEIKLTGGRTADLSTAKERGSGAVFTGFSRGAAGVWMLALMCSTCQNPAPQLLTILDPAEGG